MKVGEGVRICPASAPVRQIWRVEEERVSGSKALALVFPRSLSNGATGFV